MKIEKLSIVEKKTEKNAKLDKYVELMKKYGHPDGYDMLPQYKWYEVSFNMTDTHAGFAHGISRVLIEELETKCATVEAKNIITDDKFISDMTDGLIKNINLLPLMQSITLEELEQYEVYLYKYNDSNEIIDVKASDFVVVLKSKRSQKPHRSINKSFKKGSSERKSAEKEPSEKKGSVERKRRGIIKKGNAELTELTETTEVEEPTEPTDGTNEIDYSEDANVSVETKYVESIDKTESKETQRASKGDLNISELFPATNIIIARLRPGRYLKIKELDFKVGQSKKSAAEFSLLNNVSYYPIDIEPYSIFTGTGTRSIAHDSKEFFLSFTTAGNITPIEVMKNCHDYLKAELTSIKEKVEKYAGTDTTKKFYTDEGIEVTNRDDVFYYRLPGQYFTTINMIVQRCYLLDTSVLLCTAGVERFDTEVGLIKLKHADPNQLIITAIDSCIVDLSKMLEYFK